MSQNDGGGIVMQGAAYHFPWMHAGTVDGATKQLLKIDYPVAVIQKQAGKHFVREVPQATGKEFAGGLRVLQHVSTVQLFLQMAACHLQYRL